MSVQMKKKDKYDCSECPLNISGNDTYVRIPDTMIMFSMLQLLGEFVLGTWKEGCRRRVDRM